MQFIFVAVFAMFFGDWPQFRGPGSDGHSTEQQTPKEWSDTKNVAWKISVPGLGWSSPAISKGTVFLTSAVPYVLAIVAKRALPAGLFCLSRRLVMVW
jgi:hypothetical protein